MPRHKVTATARPLTTWDKAPVLMTTEYAALVLNISPNTLRHAAKRGDIPAIRVGRFFRFEKSSLMEWAGVKM